MRRKYVGALAKNIDPLPPSFISASSSAQHKLLALRDAEFSRRIGLLFDHYRVPPSDPMSLVIKLAQAHVPGLQEATRRGPKPRWDMFVRAFLAVDVDDLMSKNPSKSVNWACAQLVRRKPWVGRLRSRNQSSSKLKTDALRKQYEMADREMVRMVRANPTSDRLRRMVFAEE